MWPENSSLCGERLPELAGFLPSLKICRGEPMRIVSFKGLVVAGLMVALPGSGAIAQTVGGGGGGFGGHKHQQSAGKTDTQKPKADEKAYAAALKSVPDKQYDPWRGVR
jgi:hypothetical protein